MSPDSYKPFDHTREVTKLAIEWLRRDRMKLAFEILDKALRKEFDDHVSDGHSVTYYPRSALVLGKGRVLEESTDYRPVPFDWHDRRLESLRAHDRRRILEELRDWAVAVNRQAK